MAYNKMMTSRERLETVFQGKTPDRTPTIGGWLACPESICALTSITLDEYWEDPIKHSVRAYKNLGVDGLIDIFVPKSRQDYRFIDGSNYIKSEMNMNLQDTVEKIDNMLSPESIEANFDFEDEYMQFKNELQGRQKICQDIAYMPANWNAGAKLGWYCEFGYENYFLIIGMYPDRARKLMEVSGAIGRCYSRLIARAVTEGIYPHAILLGEDICTQRGPMVSPDFLEKYFAPSLKYGLEPLLEVGCKPVWHCDGDIRLLLDMLIDCGVQGLQGFQPECGMNIEYVIEKRTREGKPLLIFGPMSVTTELPVMSAKEVKERVKYVIDICKGNADLALFTSNTINPDIPVENIRAMYEAVMDK